MGTPSSAVPVVLRILTADDTDAFIRIRALSLRTDPEAFEGRSDSDPSLDPAFVRSRLEAPSLRGQGVVLGAHTRQLVGILGLAPEEMAAIALYRSVGFGPVRPDRMIEGSQEFGLEVGPEEGRS